MHWAWISYSAAFACAAKLCLQSRASWLENHQAVTTYLSFESAFPVVVVWSAGEKLSGAHTTYLVHLR